MFMFVLALKCEMKIEEGKLFSLSNICMAWNLAFDSCFNSKQPYVAERNFTAGIDEMEKRISFKANAPPVSIYTKHNH